MCTWSSANAARASATVARGPMVFGSRTTPSSTSWPSSRGVAAQGPRSVVVTSDAPLVQAWVAAGGGAASRVEIGGGGLVERGQGRHERDPGGIGHAGYDLC